MFPYHREQDYARLESGREKSLGLEENFTRRAAAIVLCIVAFTSSAVLATLFLRDNLQLGGTRVLASCEKPDTRQEWRSTSIEQRHEYIAAVQCLMKKPSRMALNHSLHADFAYSHVWHGNDAHDAAPFLVYHRWFLHLYESALRDECQYNGNMIYWDWSLDWKNPYESLLFSPTSGFGGEGTKDVTGIRGYCINEGPFANYTVPFLETSAKPHCLSREFMANETERTYWSNTWNPQNLERILSEDTVSEFLSELEDGPHNALPKLLHGDFSTRGAPFDPLFMLHHTNLDRLYWEWQTRDPEHRFNAYGGKKTASDIFDQASKDDLLFYGDLGPYVRVGEVLKTEDKRLCYRY